MNQSIAIFVSPFWESVNDQWVGGTLLALAAGMVFAQALTLTHLKSWRVTAAAILFLLLAGVIGASFADAQSPKEFQQRLMSPPSLATLTTLQLLWVGCMVFLSVKDELAEKRTGIMFWCRQGVIRLTAALPSPVMLMFLIWLEQNILIETLHARPQLIGLQVSGTIAAALLILSLLGTFLLRKSQLAALHMLTGILLMTMCVLLPCLTQKLIWERPNNDTNILPLAALLAFAAVITGIAFMWNPKPAKNNSNNSLT